MFEGVGQQLEIEGIRYEFLMTLTPHFLLFLTGALAAFLVGRLLLESRRNYKLRKLHIEESGDLTLEFALGFPIFLVIVALVVQAALMMNAILIVDHAAHGAARSAAVWIAPDTPEPDGSQNRRVAMAVPERVQRAATLLCTPVSPRLSTGAAGGRGPIPASALASILESDLLRPNRRVSLEGQVRHLFNKWSYAKQATTVEVKPLPGSQQGQKTRLAVKVTHRFALVVPFAGNLLSRLLGGGIGPERMPWTPLSATYTVKTWGGPGQGSS